MDDYLTKPIDRKVFSEVLLRHLGRTNESAEVSDHESPVEKAVENAVESSVDPSEPPIHWLEALDRCGGRPDGLRQVLKMFSQRGSAQLDKMKLLSEAGDFEDLARSAHALRGSAGNLSAYRISSLAEAIETNSKIIEPQVVRSKLLQLEAEMDRCVSWIQDRLEEVS
jgi:HPt (histidine-containing phosphotransfer) domain-containing protein